MPTVVWFLLSMYSVTNTQCRLSESELGTVQLRLTNRRLDWVTRLFVSRSISLNRGHALQARNMFSESVHSHTGRL